MLEGVKSRNNWNMSDKSRKYYNSHPCTKFVPLGGIASHPVRQKAFDLLVDHKFT